MSAPNDHDARVDRLLRRVHARFHRGPEITPGGVATTWDNPLDELIEKEERAIREAAVDALENTQAMLQLEVLPEQIVAMIREEVFRAFGEYEETLMEWLFENSPHPLPVLRRLYLYARKKRAPLIWNMSYRDLGEIFDVSHEALRIETKKHFGNLPGGATKTAEACAKMAASALGNRNRRGGHKADAAAA